MINKDFANKSVLNKIPLSHIWHYSKFSPPPSQIIRACRSISYKHMHDPNLAYVFIQYLKHEPPRFTFNIGLIEFQFHQVFAENVQCQITTTAIVF